MSIFVQQPQRSRGLSGLGAFHQLLPAIRERGVAAIADANWACNYDAIYASVYDELSRMPRYRRDTPGLRRDAAALARQQWTARCPQASFVQNKGNLYRDSGAVGMNGLGDVSATTIQTLSNQLQRSRASAGVVQGAATQATNARTSANIRDQAAVMVAPFVDSTPGTADPCLDPMTGQPMNCDEMGNAQRQLCSTCPPIGTSSSQGGSSSMPSFTVEGALPTAVAGLLGIGVGLTLISMFVGK